MAEKTLSYSVVDAFTKKPFEGNPAAVVVLEADDAKPDDGLMQRIAAEMNLSETAFVYPAGDDGTRRIRWFTPTHEVDLCGHATLASCKVLRDQLDDDGPYRFTSKGGPLTVFAQKDGRLTLDFPADPPRPAPVPVGLLEAMGLAGRGQVLASKRVYLIVLDDELMVRAIDPDPRALSKVSIGDDRLGVIATAPGRDDEVDFVSRFFGPWVGVDEDPVTGMAHTVLGPYWIDKLDKRPLEARQLSKRRGYLRIDQEKDRVLISGFAVKVAEGTLTVG